MPKGREAGAVGQVVGVLREGDGCGAQQRFVDAALNPAGAWSERARPLALAFLGLKEGGLPALRARCPLVAAAAEILSVTIAV